MLDVPIFEQAVSTLFGIGLTYSSIRICYDFDYTTFVQTTDWAARFHFIGNLIVACSILGMLLHLFCLVWISTTMHCVYATLWNKWVHDLVWRTKTENEHPTGESSSMFSTFVFKHRRLIFQTILAGKYSSSVPLLEDLEHLLAALRPVCASNSELHRLYTECITWRSLCFEIGNARPIDLLAAALAHQLPLFKAWLSHHRMRLDILAENPAQANDLVPDLWSLDLFPLDQLVQLLQTHLHSCPHIFQYVLQDQRIRSLHIKNSISERMEYACICRLPELEMHLFTLLIRDPRLEPSYSDIVSWVKPFYNTYEEVRSDITTLFEHLLDAVPVYRDIANDDSFIRLLLLNGHIHAIQTLLRFRTIPFDHATPRAFHPMTCLADRGIHTKRDEHVVRGMLHCITHYPSLFFTHHISLCIAKLYRSTQPRNDALHPFTRRIFPWTRSKSAGLVSALFDPNLVAYRFPMAWMNRNNRIQTNVQRFCTILWMRVLYNPDHRVGNARMQCIAKTWMETSV